jgi:hypothetical protein
MQKEESKILTIPWADSIKYDSRFSDRVVNPECPEHEAGAMFGKLGTKDGGSMFIRNVGIRHGVAVQETTLRTIDKAKPRNVGHLY